MKKFKFLLAAALLFSAATLISSLLAQEEGTETTKEYYATVEVEGQDTILYIRGYDAMPEVVKENVIFVQEEELSTYCTDYNLLYEDPLTLSHKIKRIKLEIDQSFKPSSTKYWFRDFENLENIEGLENLNTSEVTVMWSMFLGCKKLKSLDLSGFNTEKVTDIYGIFDGCESLEVVDLGSFNTTKVETEGFGNVFKDCSSLKYIFCDENSEIPTNKLRDRTNDVDIFANCSTLVGVAKDGTRVGYQATSGFWYEIDHNKQYFNKADDGGFFTVKTGETIEVVGLEKTKYALGEELDLRGGMLVKRIEFGQNETYEMNLRSLYALDFDGAIEGYDKAKPGKQEVSVTYGGKKYTFEVEVLNPLTDVFVEAGPSRTEYTLPITADSLDLAGGVIMKAYQSLDTAKCAMDTLEFEVVSDLDSIKPGENTLNLKFDLGDTTFEWEYKINVLEAAAEDSTGSGDDDPIVAAEDLVCGVAAFAAWTASGVLSVKAARAGVLEVLSVNGVLLRRLEVAAGAGLNLDLKPGVYVLRLGGEVRKVVVE